MDACDGSNVQIEITPGSQSGDFDFFCTTGETLCEAITSFEFTVDMDVQNAVNFLIQINIDCGMECDLFFVTGGYEIVG